MTDPGAALAAALEERLAVALASRVTVSGLDRMSGGASRETWAFDATTGDGAVHRLVLRRSAAADGHIDCALDGAAGSGASGSGASGSGASGPGAPGSGGVGRGGAGPGRVVAGQTVVGQTVVGQASMVLEAAASRAADAVGVPVPAILFASDDAPDLGGPSLVARRIRGETLARRIYRALEGSGSGGRAALGRQCAVAAARLHTVAPEAIVGLAPPADPVELDRSTIDELGVVSPAFELGLRWLDAHRPAPGRRTLVHGDFRVGNLIVDDSGLAAVLDWELVHGGDPLEDLGWFCSRAWRFGEEHLEAGGLCSVDELVAAYEGEAGVTVDRDALTWWTVLADLHWGVICAKQAERHLSGEQESVELATIGRRIPEGEWDVLAGLRRLGWPGEAGGGLGDSGLGEGGLGDSGLGEGRWRELQGRPSAAVLVGAVRQLLDGPVRQGLTGPVAFQARVAANALRMVERELVLAPAHRAVAAAALSALGCADEADLAHSIRTGRLDDRLAPAAAAAERIVAMRLDVVHPGYDS